MADLYFKINADYEELIRMQREATRLKQTLSDFSGSREEFEELNNQLNKLSASIAKTSEQAAKDFQKAFSLKDVDFSMDFAKGIEGFDKDILAFTSNLQKYFRDSQAECEGTLRVVQELSERLSNVQITPENAEQVKAAHTQLYELSEELQKQQAILSQNQAAWEDVTNAVKNGTTASMEHVKTADEYYRVSEAQKEASAAQVQSLEQVVAAEEMEAQVLEANRQEVDRLGTQALNTITQLKDMANVFTSMGVSDGGFTEQVQKLEDAALGLAGTSNVKVAQQVADEVKAVFERALDELRQAKESVPDIEALHIQENDADYRAAIDKQKEEIANIQAKRDEQRAEFEERQQQINEELEMLERRRNAYQQSIDTATAESPVSFNEEDTEHLQAVKENLAECNSEISVLRDELSQLEQAESAEASKAQQDIAEKTALVEEYRRQLSATAQFQLSEDEASAERAQKEAEAERLQQEHLEAQLAAAEKLDGETLKQIDDLQALISKERERVEVLRQQAEEAQKVAEQKVGEAKPSLLNPFPVGKIDAAEAAILDADTKAGEYEAASETLRQYESELDGLVQKLSDAGMKQYEHNEALRVAKEQSEELAKSLREQGVAGQTATGELEATSEAAKRLRFENLRQAITEGNAKLDELAQKLVRAKEAADNANDDLALAGRALREGGDDDKLVRNFEEAQEAAAKANENLQQTAAEYNNVKQGQDELNKSLSEGNEYHARMRTQIMNARDELMQMIAAGKQGTPEFQRMSQEAGNLRKQMNMANATMQYFANPNKGLATLKTSLQGVAGAAGMVTGVMGLFNSKSEDMAKIQTKIQSVMAVVVGLETTYNLVKKSSITMIALQQVKTWALALAHKGEAVATAEATVAQEGLNAAMMANPIGAIIALATAAAAAIWALWSALSSETEAEKEYKKVQEQLGSAQQDVARKTAEAYSANLKSYEDLRESYNKTANDVKAKTAWWNAHKTDLEKLGLEVDNVTGLYDVFVGQTDRVKDALLQRAKYAALCAVKTQLMADAVAAALGAGKDAAHVNDKVSGTEWNKALDWYEKQGNDVSKYRRKGLKESLFGMDMVLNTANSAQIYNMYKGQQEEARLNKVVANLDKQIDQMEKDAKIAIGNNARVTLSEIQNTKPTGRGGRGSGSTKDTYKEEDAANKRKELLEEYGKKVIAVSEKVEDDITDATLEFMGDGIDKQVAKIREGTLRQLDALEDEKEKLIEAYRKLQLDLYMTQKGAKKYDAKYNEILNTSDEEIWKKVSQTKVENAKALAEAQREERKILEAAGKENVIDELEFKFGIGNVDVVSRPMVEAKEMLKAGYAEFKDALEDGYATVYSMGNAFKDKEGAEREILYTPILPDGSVLSEKELNEYISKVVASGSSTEEILAADTKKLIIKVDAQVEDGEKLHQLQEQLYDGQQEAISKVYNERLTLNADFNTRQQQIIIAGAKAEFEILNKAQMDAIKSYEGYYDKQLVIQRKYNDTRAKLDEQRRKGLISETAYTQLNESINEREQAELSKLDLDRFKTTPMYQIAMSGDVVDSEALQKVYDEMSRQMDEAAATMQPADFKAFMDAFTNISDQMIAKNPFGALKDAVKELEYAELDLIMAHKDTLGVYQDFDINEFGQAEEGGKMWQLEQADIDAQKELTDARKAYNEALNSGDSEAFTAAKERLAEAEKNEQATALALTAARNQVANAEQKEGNALVKVQSLKKKEQKATKEAVNLTKQWASAIKDAADMFESPIASAISGMMSLTYTTLDGIESIKKASDASAEGVSKTAQAVTKAVAILAIIQAAWQVINSIMSLFGGKDEEEYKKRIDGLKAQVDALDYAFNNLKEDMDEAWGTEAIDAYIKSVETLNDRQKAQLELIKQQSKAHIGHHSLEHYMKEEAGITNKELAEAKKWIAENGGDVTTGWITDWLYTLSAEKLKEFLTTGLGTTITGKLGGVSGTGDYSGDEWLNDLQAFADSAKTAEDIADEMAAKLNGISFDGLKDELKDLIMTFDTSFNDINNSFDEFMREAAYNKARTKYDEQLKKFYEDLKDLNNLYTEGEISEEEYKKRVAELRERYKALVKGAQDDYQQSLTDAGVNVKDIEQGATTGGFEALSEDTGTELNGRFAAMQAQETITAENTTKLLEYTLNLHDIADEIRDVQVNSYMELREINENTKKVVEPILDMQENIKKIKEQTESL